LLATGGGANGKLIEPIDFGALARIPRTGQNATRRNRVGDTSKSKGLDRARRAELASHVQSSCFAEALELFESPDFRPEDLARCLSPETDPTWLDELFFLGCPDAMIERAARAMVAGRKAGGKKSPALAERLAVRACAEGRKPLIEAVAATQPGFFGAKGLRDALAAMTRRREWVDPEAADALRERLALFERHFAGFDAKVYVAGAAHGAEGFFSIPPACFRSQSGEGLGAWTRLAIEAGMPLDKPARPAPHEMFSAGPLWAALDYPNPEPFMELARAGAPLDQRLEPGQLFGHVFGMPLRTFKWPEEQIKPGAAGLRDGLSVREVLETAINRPYAGAVAFSQKPEAWAERVAAWRTAWEAKALRDVAESSRAANAESENGAKTRRAPRV
jgi:hypothetical protein